MTSRERFEAWCESESINASRLASGAYTYPSARVAWRGWQAAERQALERAAALFEDCEECTFNPKHKIRALIEGASSDKEPK